jgi:hypothetical protein
LLLQVLVVEVNKVVWSVRAVLVAVGLEGMSQAQPQYHQHVLLQ